MALSSSGAPTVVAAAILYGVTSAAPAQPAGGTPTYITDLSVCTPKTALSDSPRQGRWQTIAYETLNAPQVKSGTMISALSYVTAPEVTLPLNVSGWHAVYVAYWNPHHAYDGGTIVKVKLSGDPCFQRLVEPEPGFAPSDPRQGNWEQDRFQCYSVLREVFVRNADLSGRSLVFGKQNGPFGEKACIAYVKLVPLSAEEVTALQAERAKTDARPREGSIDGMLWGREFRTREHLLEMLEPFRYSDIGKIIWAVNYGDTTNYPSKVGRLWGSDPVAPIKEATNTYIKGQELAAKSLQRYLDLGIVPEKVVGAHLRQMGLKFDIMFRLAIGSFEGLPPRRPAHPQDFLGTHPEYRLAMADGSRVNTASYAYPQVREFMLALIEEAVRTFDPDGINLCFVRGPEFIAYDQPVLDEFRAKYGEDATKVPWDDPRFKAVRASFLSLFVRDARGVLDRIGGEKGRRIEMSAWVQGANPEFGTDTLTWVKEGWLDSVYGGDVTVNAAAAEHKCRIASIIWDINPDDPAVFSKEARDRKQDVTVRLWSVGGINIGSTDATRSALWQGAYSGG
jgi:hypothetical protein